MTFPSASGFKADPPRVARHLPHGDLSIDWSRRCLAKAEAPAKLEVLRGLPRGEALRGLGQRPVHALNRFVNLGAALEADDAAAFGAHGFDWA